jgi:hypothetical protein
MHSLSIGVIIGAALLSGNPAIATATTTTTASPSVIARRQLSDCMTKQMLASRTLSYYEASKLCKARLKAEADALTARNEARPANAR